MDPIGNFKQKYNREPIGAEVRETESKQEVCTLTLTYPFLLLPSFCLGHPHHWVTPSLGNGGQ